MTTDTSKTADDAAPQVATAPEAAEKKKKKKWDYRAEFNQVAGYIKEDKGLQLGAVVTGILLGTTALVTPALTGMIGTGIAVAAGAYFLQKAFRKPYKHEKGKKFWQERALLEKAGYGLLGLAGVAAPLLGPIAGAIAALGGGFYLLTKTSDTTVNNTSALGKKAGINPMMLGVGLGVLTSLPELFVSAGAMMAGEPGIGIGNIVGSNIANIMLILGGTAAIKNIETKKTSWKFNAAVMGGSTLLFGAQMVAGVMNPVVGGLLLLGLGGYVGKSLWDARKQAKAAKEAKEKQDNVQPSAKADIDAQKASAALMEEAKKGAGEEADDSSEMKLPKWANIGLGIAATAGLVGAAYFSVAAATALGVAAGISPAIIGLLAVAVGTSLPEMMVNFKAAMKGETDLALGNVLGSNVFNLLLIGGVLSLTGAAMPADLNPKETITGLVNTVALGASAMFAMAAMKWNKNGLGKKFGFVALGAYAAYTAVNAIFAGQPLPGAEASAAAPAAPPPPAPGLR